IVRRYVDLGKPPLPDGVAGMDDNAFQEAVKASATKLSDIRKKDDEALYKEPEEERPFKWVTSKTGVKSKVYPRPVYPAIDWQPKDLNNPTPDEVDYMLGKPPAPKKPLRPLSPERIAAEMEFFSLMMESIRRGNMIRNAAWTGGLTGIIYR